MLALQFTDVWMTRNSKVVLEAVDWTVTSDERWVMLGPNGSGKTSLLRIAGAQLHPSKGAVEILGRQLGRVDVRELRRHIGFVSGAVTRSLRNDVPAVQVVLAGKHAALETWWDEFSDDDHAAAYALLDEMGVGALADRSFGVISEGERQQVLLARSLMSRPNIILLDEPFAGMDLGARERLLARLSRIASDAAAPPLVLVTHHAEEIPPGITHAALLREGKMLAAGPIDETLSSEAVSETFGVAIEMRHVSGRWSSMAQLA